MLKAAKAKPQQGLSLVPQPLATQLRQGMLAALSALPVGRERCEFEAALAFHAKKSAAFLRVVR